MHTLYHLSKGIQYRCPRSLPGSVSHTRAITSPNSRPSHFVTILERSTSWCKRYIRWRSWQASRYQCRKQSSISLMKFAVECRNKSVQYRPYLQSFPSSLSQIPSVDQSSLSVTFGSHALFSVMESQVCWTLSVRWESKWLFLSRLRTSTIMKS